MQQKMASTRAASLPEEVKRLGQLLSSLPGGVAIAFSGGLDSRFLTYVAHLASVDILALHIRGAHVPIYESEQALEWLDYHGIPFKLLNLDMLSEHEVRKNSKERCYFCKKHMFKRLLEAAGERTLCEGSTASDLEEYRPGLKALAELNVRSPLLEMGFSKNQIRALAASIGMDKPDQKSAPCILTRFEYDLEITPDLLHRINEAEDALRVFFKAIEVSPAYRLRVLSQGDAPVKIELHLENHELSPPIQKACTNVLNTIGVNLHRVKNFKKISGFFDK